MPCINLFVMWPLWALADWDRSRPRFYIRVYSVPSTPNTEKAGGQAAVRIALMNMSSAPHYARALECLVPGASAKSSEPEDYYRLAIVDTLLKPARETETVVSVEELRARFDARGRLHLVVRKDDGKRYRAGVITKRRLDRVLRVSSR